MGPGSVRATLIIPIAEWGRAVRRIRRQFRVCQHRMWPHNVQPASTEWAGSGDKEGDLFSCLDLRDVPKQGSETVWFTVENQKQPLFGAAVTKSLLRTFQARVLVGNSRLLISNTRVPPANALISSILSVAVCELGGFSTDCPSADGLYISLSPVHRSPSNLMIRAWINWMI